MCGLLSAPCLNGFVCNWPYGDHCPNCVLTDLCARLRGERCPNEPCLNGFVCNFGSMVIVVRSVSQQICVQFWSCAIIIQTVSELYNHPPGTHCPNRVSTDLHGSPRAFYEPRLNKVVCNWHSGDHCPYIQCLNRFVCTPGPVRIIVRTVF